MKTQLINHQASRIGVQSKPHFTDGWRVLAIAMLLLVASSYASAQSKSGLLPSGIGPTSCTSPTGGGNLCNSAQYRTSTVGTVYNANLSGSPLGDGNVLNSTTIKGTGPNGAFKLKDTKIATGGAACSSGLNPTTSPSIASRIIFPAMDSISGKCALTAYGVVGHSVGWVAPISGSPTSSSAGYAGADIYVGSSDGNLYAFGYTTGTPDWMFTADSPIYSSPTTWPNLDGVYFIDNGYYDGTGMIYKVNSDSGTLMPGFPITSSVLAGGADPWSGTTGSASSVSVSTCGGLYPACNMLFAAGLNAFSGKGGIVEAYNSSTAAPIWSNSTSIPNPVTSSPVVSDSQGLVYVQTTTACGPVFGQGYQFSNGLIYALDQKTGTQNWAATAIDPLGPCPFVPRLPHDQSNQANLPPAPVGANIFSSGGSPAYDGDHQRVIASANINYVVSSSGYTYSQFEYSVLNVFDAHRQAAGGGSAVCHAYVVNPLTGAYSKVTQSSPEVVNGVIYLGTDDGFVQAYDETTCQNIWHSDQMDSGLMGPPVVSFNRVHAVSQNGTLYVWGFTNY